MRATPALGSAARRPTRCRGPGCSRTSWDRPPFRSERSWLTTDELAAGEICRGGATLRAPAALDFEAQQPGAEAKRCCANQCEGVGHGVVTSQDEVLGGIKLEVVRSRLAGREEGG